MTRIVSTHSSRCLSPRSMINFSFTTTDDRNESTCLWPPVALVSPLTALLIRETISRSAKPARGPESHTVGRRSDCTTLRRALSSLHLIPNKLSFIRRLSAYRARLRESVKVQPWPIQWDGSRPASVYFVTTLKIRVSLTFRKINYISHVVERR